MGAPRACWRQQPIACSMRLIGEHTCRIVDDVVDADRLIIYMLLSACAGYDDDDAQKRGDFQAHFFAFQNLAEGAKGRGLSEA